METLQLQYQGKENLCSLPLSMHLNLFLKVNQTNKHLHDSLSQRDIWFCDCSFLALNVFMARANCVACPSSLEEEGKCLYCNTDL